MRHPELKLQHLIGLSVKAQEAPDSGRARALRTEPFVALTDLSSGRQSPAPHGPARQDGASVRSACMNAADSAGAQRPERSAQLHRLQAPVAERSEAVVAPAVQAPAALKPQLKRSEPDRLSASCQ